MIRVLCVLGLLAAGAQAEPQEKSPGATIRGRVTDAATGQPIRMARVPIALDSRTERIEFTARTADDGRYGVEDVPAGRYIVTVSKARYVQLQHGPATNSADCAGVAVRTRRPSRPCGRIQRCRASARGLSRCRGGIRRTGSVARSGVSGIAAVTRTESDPRARSARRVRAYADW